MAFEAEPADGGGAGSPMTTSASASASSVGRPAMWRVRFGWCFGMHEDHWPGDRHMCPLYALYNLNQCWGLSSQLKFTFKG